MTEPNELVTEYLQAKAEADKAQARLDVIQARLIKEMEADQRKAFRWNDDGMVRAVIYVVRRTTEIDEAGLRKALTAKVFDRYTKRVLDRRAMEAAMDAGAVDPVTVSKYVSIKASKPYLKFSESEVKE